MKTFYSLFAITIGSFLFSQTKLIAFKSHSGNTKHFNTAVSENLFDANFSNLGNPRQFYEKTKLDSVIIFDDGESILVTRSANSLFDEKKVEWEKGRKVVRNRALFSKKNIDSVKTVLKNDFEFINNMDSVVVVKFNKKNKSYKVIKPAAAKPEKEKSGKVPGGVLLGILMFSGASGFYRWKKNKRDNEK
jgi:GH15 family glucan-1,4-alpha-glucosidase